MAGPIRLLHLSDFHFDTKRAWDSDQVLNRLAELLAGETQADRRIDLVLVTGDLAQSGSAEEYALAKAWFAEKLLPALGDLDAGRCYFVPGNHDVLRSKVSGMALIIQESLLSKKDDQLVSEVLNSAHKGVLLERFEAYQAFVQDFTGRQYADPWWHQTVPVRGLNLGLAGFCSVWMSGAREEKGKLLLGKFQLNQVFEPLRGVDLKIALIHHPASYFNDSDTHWAVLQRGCDLILRGHLHQSQYTMTFGEDIRCIELAAGSAYSGSKHHNSFQILEIDPEALALAVRPFVWQNEAWLSDRNMFPKEPEGYGRFPLRRDPEAKPRETSARGFLEAYRQAYNIPEMWDLRMIGAAYSREEKLTAIPLERIYQPQRMAEGYDPRELDKGSVFTEQELLASDRSVLIRGLAGSGKTTWICYYFSKMLAHQDLLPLLIVLRKLTGFWNELSKKGQPLDLLAYLHQSLGRLDGLLPTTLEDLFAAKEGPRPVLLIDGWDEIGPLGDELRQTLLRLQRQYPRILVVATSRPFGKGMPSGG